jgi:hypothetical protein
MAGYDDILAAVSAAENKPDLKNRLDALRRANKGYYIDDKKRDADIKQDFTVAAKLAYESRNNESLGKKVKWLRQLGADPSEIAMGYAMAGDNKRVNFYRNKLKADPNKILHGYILGNHNKYVTKYIDMYGAKPLTAITAYAILGDGDLVKSIINTYKTLSEEQVWNAIVSGWAQGGHDTTIDEKYLSLAQYAPAIVYGYALVGNQARVNEIVGIALQDFDNTDENHIKYRSEIFNNIATGYAEGGHHELAKQLHQEHPKIPAKAFEQGYKARLDVGRANEFNLSKIVTAYLKERKNIKDGKEGPTREYKTINFPFFQFSFTKKKAAVEALKEALKGNYDANNQLTDHLPALRDGNLGKGIRKFVKEGFADELVGKEVRTVSDFVKALHQQNKVNVVKAGVDPVIS